MARAFSAVCARRRRRSVGAALVIALVLLLILTLLATAGARMSIAELWMAGNEQYRRKASDAASAGIEAAVARISVAGAAVAREAPLVGPVAIGEPPSETYAVSIRYTGKEASLPGSSAEKFAGEHLEIESTGTSVRTALDVQVQGVLVVSTTHDVKTYRRGGIELEMAGAR